MLTTAQQKVKQELEELKANGCYHRHDEEIIVVPPKTNFSVIFTVVGVGLLFLILAIIVIIYRAPNQKELNEYIIKEQEYNQESMKLMVGAYDGADQIDIGRLKLANANHADLVLNVKKMPVPTGLKAHKQDFLRVMEQRAAILTMITESKAVNYIQLNKLLLELDIKQEMAKESLLREFDREKVKYKLNEDGSVQYWINRESHQFGW
ncbi:hypothetical protein [Neobacillus niacini]|uniref:hypothetical protein n=1 Tax=Neobacillus niacini TaxID=86668 RepID=UPI0021CB3987|nr:hypothetical protein [Neobacillus niacini]MCM3763524.1 hypothetical protein [Neobacillus niacini]